MTDTNNTAGGSGQVPPKFEMRMPEGYEKSKGHHARLGPILAVLIVVLALIFGGLYLWGGMLGEQAGLDEGTLMNNEPETPRAAADANILETMSPSDDLSAIEADLSSTNLDSIDADLNAIDGELGN